MNRYFPGKTLLVLLLLFIVILPQSLFALPAEGVTPINNRGYVASVHKLFQNAQSSIRIMAYQAWFYEDYPDSDSNIFLEELIDARKRGVDVKVFLETSNWNQNLDNKNKDYAKRLEDANIPVFFDHKEITSHEKVIIIDGFATVVSSNNWSHFSLWINNEVAVIIWSRQVAKAFGEYLNELMRQAGHDPLSLETGEKTISMDEFKTYPARDILLMNNRDYFPMAHEAFQSAKEKIRVVQRSALYYTMVPSYAPEKNLEPGEPVSQVNILIKDLIEAKKHGVDVQVVLDAEVRKRRSTGEWTVNYDNEDTAMRLLAGGVTVYYDSLTTQTHAKMLIVDDQTVVGSTNWTYNAVEIGNEASVLIKSKPVAEVYYQFFDDLKEAGIQAKPGFDLFSLKRELEAKDKKNPKK